MNRWTDRQTEENINTPPQCIYNHSFHRTIMFKYHWVILEVAKYYYILYVHQNLSFIIPYLMKHGSNIFAQAKGKNYKTTQIFYGWGDAFFVQKNDGLDEYNMS